MYIKQNFILIMSSCDNFTYDYEVLSYRVNTNKFDSANSVSLTLRAKFLVKIQIGSPSETTLSVY